MKPDEDIQIAAAFLFPPGVRTKDPNDLCPALLPYPVLQALQCSYDSPKILVRRPSRPRVTTRIPSTRSIKAFPLNRSKRSRLSLNHRSRAVKRARSTLERNRVMSSPLEFLPISLDSQVDRWQRTLAWAESLA